jgi:hypothetical protein
MEMSYSYNQYFIRPNLVNNTIRELFDEATSCALTQLLPSRKSDADIGQQIKRRKNIEEN